METLHAPSIAPHEDRRAEATGPLIVPAKGGLVDVEAALSLIRISNAPVLAAASGFTRSPRRIVVGVDFSAVSLRVARLAVELAGPNALIYLAHAISRDSALRDASTVGLSSRHAAADALLKMCAQLRLAPGASLHRILLQGDPATELLTFARNGSAELIAIGSHGHRGLTRQLAAGVAIHILEHSSCSVLTVPCEVNTTVAPFPAPNAGSSPVTHRLIHANRTDAGQPLAAECPACGARTIHDVVADRFALCRACGGVAARVV